MNRYQRQTKGMIAVIVVVILLVVLGELFPAFKSICTAPGMGAVFAALFIGIIAAFGGFKL